MSRFQVKPDGVVLTGQLQTSATARLLKSRITLDFSVEIGGSRQSSGQVIIGSELVPEHRGGNARGSLGMLFVSTGMTDQFFPAKDAKKQMVMILLETAIKFLDAVAKIPSYEEEEGEPV